MKNEIKNGIILFFGFLFILFSVYFINFEHKKPKEICYYHHLPFGKRILDIEISEETVYILYEGSYIVIVPTETLKDLYC